MSSQDTINRINMIIHRKKFYAIHIFTRSMNSAEKSGVNFGTPLVNKSGEHNTLLYSNYNDKQNVAIQLDKLRIQFTEGMI